MRPAIPGLDRHSAGSAATLRSVPVRASQPALAAAEAGTLRLGPDLPGNTAYADHRAAQFRQAVDKYVARAGIVAPPPGVDPAERSQPMAESPEKLSMRAERIAAVIWCTGFGPGTGWLCAPLPGPDGSPLICFQSRPPHRPRTLRSTRRVRGNDTRTC
jgi:hypothetical protein